MSATGNGATVKATELPMPSISVSAAPTWVRNAFTTTFVPGLWRKDAQVTEVERAPSEGLYPELP